MTASQIGVCKGPIASLLLIFVAAGLCAATATTNQDYNLLGEQVLRLLESRDIDRFANELAPSINDWRSVRSTNAAAPPNAEDPLGPGFEKGLNRQRRQVADSARLAVSKRHLQEGRALTIIPGFRLRERLCPGPTKSKSSC